MNLTALPALTDHRNRTSVLAAILVTHHPANHRMRECEVKLLLRVTDNTGAPSVRARDADFDEPVVAPTALRPWKSDFQ
ncbi:MAG: hypothetical protein ABI887_03680 [Burkholderiales bacterium]